MRNEFSGQKSGGDEYLFEAIRKIGLIAACIDLHHWRLVIDDILREVDADNQKADIQQPVPQHNSPSNRNATATGPIRRTSAAMPPRLVTRTEERSLLLVSVSKTTWRTERAA